MLKILFSKNSQKFLQKLTQKKHLKQIQIKIQKLLQDDPYPSDYKHLLGELKGYLRVDIGEYRIIYKVETAPNYLKIILVGRRNDSEAYKQAKRIMKTDVGIQ